MAGEVSTDERSLEYTPTWALATVCSIFVFISLVVERFLHWLGEDLHRKKRKAMYHALQKIKDELMLVGFISLTLILLQERISKICIKSSLYTKWSPCKMETTEYPVSGTATSTTTCQEGYEPFLSTESLHQLHIFIFVLAANHVLYTFLTMALALLKVFSWKKWEKEAHESTSPEGMAELVVNNISYTRQSTFMRYHTSKPWSKSRIIVWVVCFFQQFHIPRADYLTLRFSFITTHNLPNKYDFHDYMMRSMEDEFQTIVGISAWLWGFVVIFMLFNVQGVNLYFWSSFIPVLFIVAIGTKLQHVVATLAMESTGALPFPGPFTGAQLKPHDKLFWFNRPKLLLHVIHLVLFQSAFEMSTFIWQVWQFGFKSCLLEENKGFVYTRLAVGFGVQLFCSFSTLPLYALVSQMGSMYKKAAVAPRINRVLHVWHKDAKKRLKRGVKNEDSNRNSTSGVQNEGVDAYDDYNDSSFVTLPMEEGSSSRIETQPLKPSSSSSVAKTAENIWARRLQQSTSGKRKALHPIQETELQHQHGVLPFSTALGTELRHRTSPNDLPPDSLDQQRAMTTPKPPFPSQFLHPK